MGQNQSKESMRFHPIAGQNIEFFNNRNTACRRGPGENNGLVYTNHPMEMGEIFEVCLTRNLSDVYSGTLALGVTCLDPNDTVIPETLIEMVDETWCLSSNIVYSNGESAVSNYSLDLDELMIGDTVGVSVNDEGALSFYKNGVSHGEAIQGVTCPVFGVVDIYGTDLQISVVDVDTPRFLDRSGHHVDVINSCLTAKRSKENFNNGVVLTHRALKHDELFEVTVDRTDDSWCGALEIGITTHNPYLFYLPPTMSSLDNGCCLMIGNYIMENGQIKKENYSGQDLESIEEGDKVGLMVKSGGKLHFFINGEDQGEAANNIPDVIYGFISLYGKTIQVSINTATTDPTGHLAQDDVCYPFKLVTPEGITITVKLACITDEKVDAIVNTTNPELDLSKGNLSATILEKAGPSILAECGSPRKDKKHEVPFGTIVKTSGGNLACRNIYHGPVQRNDTLSGEKNLEMFLRNVLLTAHNNGDTSLALPAIGTGHLGFPAQDVAKLITDEITEFGKLYPYTTLKDIRLVIHPNDTKTKTGLEEYYTCPESPPGDHLLRTPQKVVTELPKKWDEMPPNTLCHLVELQKGCAEYKDVQVPFFDTLSVHRKYDIHVVKIERVQSPNLYHSYMSKKEQMNDLIADQKRFPLERILYHGTKAGVVNNINTNGFNRAYAGENGEMLGKGLYFARDAEFSCNTRYSAPEKDTQHRKIYQCKVLTGEYTTGKRKYIEAPPKNPMEPTILFNSTVDDVDKPTMFAIYEDYNAYPEYLITFKS